LRGVRAAGLRFREEALLPDDRDRDEEARFFEVPLLRDAGGEDVRVAMLANLP
jgi:hypothetical protein